MNSYNPSNFTNNSDNRGFFSRLFNRNEGTYTISRDSSTLSWLSKRERRQVKRSIIKITEVNRFIPAYMIKKEWYPKTVIYMPNWQRSTGYIVL